MAQISKTLDEYDQAIKKVQGDLARVDAAPHKAKQGERARLQDRLRALVMERAEKSRRNTELKQSALELEAEAKSHQASFRLGKVIRFGGQQGSSKDVTKVGSPPQNAGLRHL